MNGALTLTHPDTGPSATAGAAMTGATSDDVVPARTLTTWREVPESFWSRTSWSPLASPSTVMGATPRGVPSTVTLAPAGWECTTSIPVVGDAANSRYCETCPPDGTCSGITRGTPRPRSSRMCEPAATETLTGVMPRATPSTNTSTPAGLDWTTSVPSVGSVPPP